VLVLYTTAGCYLCEQAEALLQQASGAKRLAWQSVDIAERDELVQRYGVSIPVLYDTASDAELGWPFNASELDRFLNHP
jgi:hypothetical protein